MKVQPQSSKPGKQRKWIATAPLGKRQKMIGAILSKELRAKYKRRNLPLRKGDKVKVMRGDFKGVTGEVMKVSLKDMKVLVDGITIKKASGTDVERPLDPSNLMLTDLNIEDKERRDILERKTK